MVDRAETIEKKEGDRNIRVSLWMPESLVKQIDGFRQKVDSEMSRNETIITILRKFFTWP